MTGMVGTRKLTIMVSEPFYDGLLRSAGPRKMGAFIERHLAPLVATKKNLEEGYKAMAADEDRELEAQEWCNNLSGRTLNNEAW